MEKLTMDAFNFKLLPSHEVREAWEKYKRNFNYMSAANEVTDQQRMVNIFLSKAGRDVQDVFHTIVQAIGEEDDKPFDTMISKLDGYFAPKHHDTFARHLFWNLKQEEGESLYRFMLRVNEWARKSNFGSSKEKSEGIGVMDKIIMIAPKDLKEKLLQKENL